MRTVLLGAPGSGKGTQSVVLSKKYDIPQISTGDLLRAAVTANSALGQQAKSAMDAGALVTDEIVVGLIRERIAQDDATNGYILDGFPRNIPQAEALDAMLSELNQPLQCVILLDVAFEELLQRLTGRRTCKDLVGLFIIFTFHHPNIKTIVMPVMASSFNALMIMKKPSVIVSIYINNKQHH